MTLIIAVASHDNAILASDRRLTFPDGSVAHDETCKLTVYACNDAKVMIAYTGLASIGGDSTGDWIINTLSTASKEEHSIYKVIDNFIKIANSAYEQLRDVRFKLELIFAGYQYPDSGVAEPMIWKISNLDNDNEFKTIYCHGDKGVYFELAGNACGVSEDTKSKIRDLMLQKQPAHGIEMKLVNTIKTASKKTPTVGRQINSCCLNSSLNSQFTATYHSDITQRNMYAVNSVFAIANDSPSVMKGATLTVGKDCPPVSLPKAKPNQICPCGSGEKYKRCHGNIKYPYLPLSHEVDFTDDTILKSGSKFTIRSYGAY